MVDLIVPAGTVVTISQPSQVEPRYAVFRMESNSKIVASIDLKITASRAEFGENCIIDASGAPGANGNNGANGPLGVTGGAGTDGLPGQNGRSVTIEAGLTNLPPTSPWRRKHRPKVTSTAATEVSAGLAAPAGLVALR